jgi:hypothetical protein
MGLLISVFKPESEIILDKVSSLCEKISEYPDRVIFVPSVGKIIDVLKIIRQHHVQYSLMDDQQSDRHELV